LVVRPQQSALTAHAGALLGRAQSQCAL